MDLTSDEEGFCIAVAQVDRNNNGFLKRDPVV